ncbi:hypothetical protein [Clostridium kluyveri]|uniref:Morphogenetic protein n=1 Tax=Clostridium kluyveri TaxID=1534 RepID=A0A1L5F8Q6_CLOKL|nr:hypothetical protein [Clostridium kluyveri]APM39411.1 hypothetical protein BS101_11990 [Clostridium kluyveri]
MKPIIFNTKMIKAILESRKTQTRRIIKEYIPEDAKWGYTFFTPKHHVSFRGIFDGQYGEKFYKLPYWIGDILYVRETFANTWTPDGKEGFVYKADGEPSKFPYWGNANQCKDEVWIPSIHMPKKAARIFLKVTDIKVQRIQDITEDEAKKEGIKEKASYNHYSQKFFNGLDDNYKYGFGKLWDSCGYKWPNSWSGNPWVWVFEFEKIDIGEVHGE